VKLAPSALTATSILSFMTRVSSSVSASKTLYSLSHAVAASAILLRDRAERFVSVRAAEPTNYARKNIKGKRTSWKSVNDVNIFAAERLCPVNEYVTKARTEARAGRETATAFIPALIIRRVRIYLDEEQLSTKQLS
jgi:hypothetical protein